MYTAVLNNPTIFTESKKLAVIETTSFYIYIILI